MTENAPYGRNAEDSHVSRRGYLASAGGLGASLVGGGLAYPRYPDEGADDDPSPPSDRTEERDDFLWLGGGLWQDPAVRRNLFAFARRHDLAVVLVKSQPSDGPVAETLGPPMVAAREFGLDVWLNVGLLNELPAEAFVTDEAAREAHLEWLSEVARVHGESFETGRVVLWQEAPVMGQWVEGGAWTGEAVENLLEYGPEIFTAQKRAIEAANDALEVGLFVHFPYIVDSKRPEVFERLVDGLEERNTDPDFGFVDFYRGWYEKDVGPEPANTAVRSLVSNTRTALGDRPVFYLGQSHTINPNHTPSKQALRMNLRASLEAGADGLGWYIRSGYVPTESGFDPFVPNVEGAEVDGDSVNTFSIARDRFLYSWMATLRTRSGFDPGTAFDLWLVGDGFGFHDHRLSVRTTDGEWEYVGDFSGYADGDYPAGSSVTDRATVFRALDRNRLLGDETLECRIATAEGSAGAVLRSAFVMPWDADAYVSEQEAASFARGDTPLEAFSLGRTRESTTLVPGESRRITIPVVDAGSPSLDRLRHPDSIGVRRRLATFEHRERVDPSARFDLWVSGTGLVEPSVIPSIVDRDGNARAPADLGVVASEPSLAICHGLERDRFLGDGGLELVRDGDGSVEACYAMPYAGSATFRSPARAADLLAEQPDEARIFSLDFVILE